MKQLTHFLVTTAILALLAACGSDGAATGGIAGTTEDRSVDNARALSATSMETGEPDSGNGSPETQPENTEPAAL